MLFPDASGEEGEDQQRLVTFDQFNAMLERVARVVGRTHEGDGLAQMRAEIDTDRVSAAGVIKAHLAFMFGGWGKRRGELKVAAYRDRRTAKSAPRSDRRCGSRRSASSSGRASARTTSCSAVPLAAAAAQVG